MSTTPTRKSGTKRVYTGLIIATAGVIWLLRPIGYHIPEWLISWQVLLIVIGLGIGLGSRFRNPASYVLILIGAVFLIDNFNFIPVAIRDYLWPLALIVLGLIVALRPPKKRGLKSTGTGISSEEERGSYDYGDKPDNACVFSSHYHCLFHAKPEGAGPGQD